MKIPKKKAPQAPPPPPGQDSLEKPPCPIPNPPLPRTPAQPNLFGDFNAIENTLVFDVKSIEAQISGCRELIERKESQIRDLEEKLGEAEAALGSLRSIRDLKKKTESANP